MTGPFAYIVLSHREPGEVLRLLRALRAASPGAAIAVHHDAKQPPLAAPKLAALAVKEIRPRLAVRWGDASQLALQLHALAWALGHFELEWLTLLSGQDYPLGPLAGFESRLGAEGYDGYLEGAPVTRPRLGRPVDEFATRYFYRWRRLPDRPRSRRALERVARRAHSTLLVRHTRGGLWVGAPRLHTPFKDGLTCFRGADWFSLSRASAQRVLAARADRPDLLAHYASTLSPAESFAQTVLHNDATVRLSGDYGRYTVWPHPSAPSPRVLGLADLDAMLASGAPFARKFDAGADGAVLDELDERLRSVD